MPDEMVSPMPARVSMDVMTAVALPRSPPTPAELSPPKNMRSPASEARAQTTSISQSRAPVEVALDPRDPAHEPADRAALLDGGDVDDVAAAQQVGGDGVRRLVDGRLVLLELGGGHAVGHAVHLEDPGLDDVGPRDEVAPVADGHDQRLVHDVLDHGARRVRRHQGQALDLLGREHVAHLGEVALERAAPAVEVRVVHVVHAVDAARAAAERRRATAACSWP